MPTHRFYLKNITDTLDGQEFHHLKNVMRARAGDLIEIVNGKGTLIQARLIDIGKNAAYFEIVKKTEEPPPSTSLILAQALTRPALLDWIIEKGTELGATEFWLFPGEQSEKKELTPHQLERLHTLIISALKQCGRLYLPTLHIKPPLSRWQKPAGTVLYGSLAPTAQPIKKFPSPVTIVIGPEKGLTHDEQTTLETKLGALGVTLHPNTLRAETAALCALSLLSYF